MSRLDVAVISLFPEMFKVVSEFGVVGKALESKHIQLSLYNPRDYALDKHRTVDDRPYGGGAGMVMAAPPLKKALLEAKKNRSQARVIYLSPQGRRLDQAYLCELSQHESHILVCGRYGGLDERFIEQHVDEECSIGDFVISGGELAAMVMIDALARMVPGVCGSFESVEQDSFYNGLLDCPLYTRPVEFEGLRVPEVLLSGDHKKIEQWRQAKRLSNTNLKRPDLAVFKESANKKGVSKEDTNKG